MTTETVQAPIVVSLRKQSFDRGMKLVKGVHAKYDAATRTWTIPANMVEHLRFVGCLDLVSGTVPAANHYGEAYEFGNTKAAPVVAPAADPYMGQMCPNCHSACYGDCKS